MLAGFLLNASIFQSSLQNIDWQVQTHQSVAPYAYANVIIRDHNGNVKYNYTTPDLVTSLGSKWLVWQATAASTSNESLYMAWSTDATPLVTWVDLPNYISTNGLAISSALTPTIGSCTTTNGLSWYYTITNTWSSITGTQTGIVCMGIYYLGSAPTTNNLAFALSITSASVVAGDSLQGTFNCTIPCG